MNKQLKFQKDDVEKHLYYFNGNYAHEGHGEPTPSQQLLESLKKWSGLQGSQLAKAIGISASTYYKILEGTVRDPRMKIFNKILGLYSRYYLMYGKE